MITYDPKKVILMLNGVLITGFAEDTFVEIEYNSERYAVAVGADGAGIRSKRNDRSATVRITLTAGVLANNVLQGMMALDDAANAGAVLFKMTDKGTGRSYSSVSMWVNKDPEGTYGTTAAGQVWELSTDELLPLIASAP